MKYTREIILVFSFIFIFLTLSGSVFADKNSHFEIAYQLTGLVMDKNTISNLVRNMMENNLKAAYLKNQKMQPYADTVIKLIVDTIEEMFNEVEFQERLREDWAKAYVELFTEAELQEIMTFFSSDVGQKLTRTQPELYRRFIAIGVQTSANSSAKFEQKLEERIREAQEKGLFPRMQSDSKESEFLNKQGNEHLRKGEYDQAISVFSKALEIDPKHAIVYNNRGIAYSMKGEYDLAISDFSKAVEISPRYAEAYKNRGLAYDRKGKYNNEAISDFSKALEISPNYALAYILRGSIYVKKSRYDQAIADFTKALDIDQQNPMASNSLAWLLATTKEARIRDGEKALGLAIKACQLTNFENPYYLGTMAAAYARTGDFDNAIGWQEKALDLHKTDQKREAQRLLDLYRNHKPWPPD